MNESDYESFNFNRCTLGVGGLIITGLRMLIMLVLTFIGAKMLIAPWYHVPVAASLTIVTVLIGASVFASLLVSRRR